MRIKGASDQRDRRFPAQTEKRVTGDGGEQDRTAELKEQSRIEWDALKQTYHGEKDAIRSQMSPAMKELIATAIAITEECDGCIASHARGAARKGATDAEFAEMVGVASLMQGGPGTIYGPRAWEAFQEFKS